jgi:Fur family transcriptional regulator, peroxide stress response regulator
MDLSHEAVEHRLAAFRQRCAGLGLALTPQRLAIYQVLAGDDSHPGAEDIYRRIKPNLPSLSLGTVYRTLELFEEHGLVSRVNAFGDQTRFDANLEPHHHLICVQCRKIFDYRDPRLEELPVPRTNAEGFHILAHQIHFFGECQSCRQSAN